MPVPVVEATLDGPTPADAVEPAPTPAPPMPAPPTPPPPTPGRDPPPVALSPPPAPLTLRSPTPVMELHPLTNARHNAPARTASSSADRRRGTCSMLRILSRVCPLRAKNRQRRAEFGYFWRDSFSASGLR